MQSVPDFQCTWWRDIWWGVSINDCCVRHDLGSPDLDLLWCVADKGGWEFLVLGIVMYIGVKVGRPFYRLWMTMIYQWWTRNKQ